MLFNKKIEPSCSYCAKGVRLDDEQVACKRCGIVSSGSQCSRFKYDPLKRMPSKPVSLNTDRYSEQDFVL